MADDENSQRDELDAALTARLRALRPSLPVPAAGAGEPSDEELLRYIDGAMSDAESALFEAILADQPHAAERVAIVADALAEAGFGPTPRSAPVGRRAVSLAARFVFSLSDGVLSFLRGTDLPRGLAPALAVRSSAPAKPQSFFEFVSQYPFESGAVDARLALEPVSKQSVDVQLEITQGGAPLDGVRVKLHRDGRPVDSAPTEQGRCTFSALAAARYELEIRKGGTEVGRMVLDIRGDSPT